MQKLQYLFLLIPSIAFIIANGMDQVESTIIPKGYNKANFRGIAREKTLKTEDPMIEANQPRSITEEKLNTLPEINQKKGLNAIHPMVEQFDNDKEDKIEEESIKKEDALDQNPESSVEQLNPEDRT